MVACPTTTSRALLALAIALEIGACGRPVPSTQRPDTAPRATTPGQPSLAACPGAAAGVAPETLPITWAVTADAASPMGILEAGLAVPYLPDWIDARWGEGVHAVALTRDAVIVLWQCAAFEHRRQCQGSYQETGIGCDPMPEPAPRCTGAPGLHVEAFSFKDRPRLWERVIGGPGFASIGRPALAVDRNGEIFVTGHFSGAIDSDGATVAARGLSGTFATRLASDGAVRWIRAGGGPSLIYYWGPVIAPDDAGGVIVGAQVARDEQATALDTGANDNDVVVTRWGADGALQWTHRIGGRGWRDEPAGLAILPDGAIAVSGSIEFDQVAGACPAAPARPSGFVELLGPDGVPAWLVRLGPGQSGPLVRRPGGELLVTGLLSEAHGGLATGPYLAALTTKGLLQWTAALCRVGAEAYTHADTRSMTWPRPWLAGMCMGGQVAGGLTRRFRIESAD